MKKIIVSLLLLLSVSALNAQTKTDFDAAITRFRHFFNLQLSDSIYNMLSEQGKKTLTPDKAADAFTGIYKQYGDLKSFEMIYNDAGLATYKANFSSITFTLLISLNKDNRLETFRFLPYKESTKSSGRVKEKSNFSMKAGTGTIYGSYVLPDGGKKVPVVLIIAGSGPTDRDCNSAMGANTDAFFMIADSLKKAGIASLRYDKRGIAESAGAMKEEKDLRFDDYVSDAAAILKLLKMDHRFSSVYVMGHSEGSLIGMIAAKKEKIAGYISLSGAGEPAGKLITDQLSVNSSFLAEKAGIIIDSIKKGFTVTDIPSDLNSLFHESVQPYLHSWLKYDPQVEIKKLKVPVLIVQGTNDLQVSQKEADLLKKAYPSARLQLVEGMNHILKQAPTDRRQNFATYNDPTLPLSSGLMPGIIQFILSGK